MLHKGLHFRGYHFSHCYTPCLNLLPSHSLDPKAHQLMHINGQEDLLECWNHCWCIKNVELENPREIFHCQNCCDGQREKQARFHSPLQFLHTADFSKDMVSKVITPWLYNRRPVPGFHCPHTLTCISHYLKVVFVGIWWMALQGLPVYSSCRQTSCGSHLYLSWEILLSPLQLISIPATVRASQKTESLGLCRRI